LLGRVLVTVIERIDRFNAAHPWSHNDFYHRWLLRQLPARLRQTIDVGCGTGNLVLAISRRADVAEGIDADPAVIAAARAHAQARPNAVFAVRDLTDMPGGGQYDAVTAIAVVHHLPLTEALTKMRSLVAPGGRIVIIGCYRAATATDYLVDVVASPANMLMGLLKSAGAREARVAMSAPTAAPQHTLADIRHTAAAVLPGSRIRRRLFWRYSLTYTAPGR
jgi:SAM-dependent methyltransferase